VILCDFNKNIIFDISKRIEDHVKRPIENSYTNYLLDKGVKLSDVKTKLQKRHEVEGNKKKVKYIGIWQQVEILFEDKYNYYN
jgi:phosphoribosyl-ATP pyrophosphohydrolase